MMFRQHIVSYLILCGLFFCINGKGLATSHWVVSNNSAKTHIKKEALPIKYLALGDSYTIGERVCEQCRYPKQLALSLGQNNTAVDLDIIARTGWTTSDLLKATATGVSEDYDLVTLLIGVNNQYRQLDFETFKTEFELLLDRAVRFAQNKHTQVMVLSIPDYAYTRFGKGNKEISKQIKQYNDYSNQVCKAKDISYVYITDITQQGLSDPSLVAKDGLHPSKKAYAAFVKRLLPKVLKLLDATE